MEGAEGVATAIVDMVIAVEDTHQGRIQADQFTLLSLSTKQTSLSRSG